ncbi:MAG: type IV secretion system DNA-binding domain-containing protein [Dysgonamonadaceae bacterium]|jgi:DNA sulfur modification protein DndE|nr:type IV secretion system DNA-binding domain-containing protein [Dysgonamonadaceae bacterium]
MRIKPSLKSEQFIESVYMRVGAENKAVFARSAIALALAEGVPRDFALEPASGKDIDLDTIAKELIIVFRAAINYRAGKILNDTEFLQEFRRYFEWGCQKMRKIWEEDAGEDNVKFAAELLKRTKMSDTKDIHYKTKNKTRREPLYKIVTSEVKLQILNETESWSLNGPGTDNGLLIISGAPGAGKTQLALDLLAQLSEQGLRFAFFDLKGELEKDETNENLMENRKKFFEQTGASYIRLIDESLPINPLWRETDDTANSQIAYEMSALFSCFVPSLGAIQIGQLQDSYQELESPDFYSWFNHLEEQGISGVHREILKRICEYRVFSNAANAIPLENWLNSSLVIDFKKLGNDDVTKALAVTLLLNMLMKKLNSQLAPINNIQPLKMVLFVDEAHLLLPKEGRTGLLGSLARQGRSWGFPVWLASQDIQSFDIKGSKAVDFSELAKCGVHFTPGNLSPAEKKQYLGGIPRDLQKYEAAVRINNNLTVGAVRQYWKNGGRL